MFELAYATGEDAAAARFGLVKEAIVSSEKKQYRRAVQLLAPAMGKAHPKTPPPPQFFHGTSGSETQPNKDPAGTMRSIVESGHILPSTAGMHGPGTYLWHNQPLETYINRPSSWGVALPQDAVGPHRQQPDDPAPGAGKRREVTVFHSKVEPRPPKVEGKPQEEAPLPPKDPQPLKIPEGRDTTIIAPSAALKNKDLPQGRSELSRALELKTHRHIDSAIFHRAEADLRAGRRNSFGDYEGYLEGSGITPTTSELKKQRATPVTFPLLRAGTDLAPHVRGEKPIVGVEKFMQEYAKRVPRAQR